MAQTIIINNKEWSLTEFITELSKFNSAYRKGDPLISDKQYDYLVDELKAQYPDHDWFWTIEPNEGVSQERKVKLPVLMKSLDKVKSFAELEAWFKSCGLRPAHEVLCMPKFDGGSLLTDERNKKGYTRGGAENEGQNCDIHIARANILLDDRYQYTFGEFLISNKDWDAHFKGQINPKSNEVYKSPRNVAVGMLNSDTPPASITKSTFFRFGASGWSPEFATQEELIRDLCNTYEQPHLYHKAKISDINHEVLLGLYEQWTKEFGLDGIVIYVNDLEISDKLGRHSSGNPMYAIAYKAGFEEEIETPVLSITTEVSKNGYLRPTVQIEPVSLASSTVSNPTGNNMRFIKENRIAKGAIVKVIRSGEVIPKIVGVVKNAGSNDIDHLFAELSKCPSCKCTTQWNPTETDLMCINPKCDGIMFAKIYHFFTTVGCDGLGKENFKKLFDNGFDSVGAILSLSVEDITSIEGFGVSTARLILEMNQRIATGIGLDVLMAASDCFAGIGLKKSRNMLEKFGVSSHTQLFGLSQAQHILSDVKSVTETNFINGIAPFLEFVSANTIIANDIELKVPVNENGKYAGMFVCFSGVRDKELEGFITAEGGVVVSSVSKKTTHLIVKDVSERTSKVIKAMEQGTEVITIDLFRRI